MKQLTSKQFAWYYLVANGYEGVQYGTYGVFELRVDYSDPEYYKKRHRSVNYVKLTEEAKKKIRRIGVDWEKTCAPSSDSVSLFAGTFCDPDVKETLVGELVLKNGDKQHWVADGIKVSNVFDMMANMVEVLTNFDSIFGKGK